MDNVRRYLEILEGSKKFEKRIKDFRAKYKNIGIPEEELNKILTDFFIPVTDANSSLMLFYVLSGNATDKVSININMMASKEKPMSIKIEEPSIVLQITDDLNAKDWANIRKYYVQLRGQMANERPPTVFKKAYHIKRNFPNIDLLLEIYALHLQGYSLKRITEEIPKIKIKIEHKNTIYTLENTRRLLKEIQELISSIQ